MIDRVLRPLIRLMIARGVLFPALSERMKRLYVEAAVQDINGKRTDSRISVLTGLQRRDIARLRNAAPRARSEVNHLSRLVAQWQARRDTSRNGVPLPLKRKGETPSFEMLAQDIRSDIHPRTMFEQLLATGTIAHDVETDIVTLEESAYIPLAGSEEQLNYLAENLGDHAEATVENVLTDAVHFERAVHYNGLDTEAIARLEAFHAEQQSHLLARLNQMARDLQDEAPAGGTGRFRAGGYFFSTEESDT